MKRGICLFVLVILLLASMFSSFLAAEEISLSQKYVQNKNLYAQCGRGYRYNIQGWIYTHIEGDPYERGYQHGYLLADEIIDMINRWSNIIHNYPLIKPITHHMPQKRYELVSKTWWDFCRSNCVKTYWDKYSKYNDGEYLQEMRGIADGVKSKGGKIHGQSISTEDILTLNEMYEFLSKLNKLKKRFHPLRTLFHKLKQILPELSKIKEQDFITDFIKQPMPHHCSGFIATGNATSHGQIVIADSMWCGGGSWWWTYYIALRWNVILDIKPTQGHRIIMPASPGFIWSNHDFYQNDAGIVLIETTLRQGLWDNRGLPLAIRARAAMQYGENIDDVIHYLRHQNDGCMNAVWLIGDTKNGEIARFELGLYAYAVYRTFNGFYWSANNPMDLGVRLEKFDIKTATHYLLRYLLLHKGGYEYCLPKYRPAPRDLKFEELGNKYYGKIDVDLVKKIMSTRPISAASTDCKITDSNLVEKNGLWAFIGNPSGKILELSNLDKNKIKNEEIHPTGWVRIYALPWKEYIVPNNPQEQERQPETIWLYDTKNNSNDFYSSSIIVGNTLYTTTSSGEIYALDAQNGTILWNQTVGKQPTQPTYHNQLLFIGTADGLKVLDITGQLQWEKNLTTIPSPPVIAGDLIITGDKNGNIYAFDIHTGDEQWNLTLSGEIYISQPWNKTMPLPSPNNNDAGRISSNSSILKSIFVGSGNTCYAIDAETGNIEWSIETNGIITSKPVVYDKTVYFGSWDTYLYAAEAHNGSIKWKRETGWGIETTPVISNDMIFFGSHDNNLYALNKTSGQLKWVFTCNAAIHSSPIVNEKNIFFGSDDGRLYALNKSVGKLVWSFSPGYTIDRNDIRNYITTPILSTPVLHNNILFIGVLGKIYALDASTS
ncbi:MAG: hypothetical protein DRN05_01565 [Thermoplasmata archaeon]|nr:MAG: hypothetical protein DRN05_01565 [Thermoplasmata archaeon]